MPSLPQSSPTNSCRPLCHFGVNHGVSLLGKYFPSLHEGEGKHEFMYGKSRLTSLIAFSDKMTGFVGNRGAEYVIYFDFSTAFGIVFLYPSEDGMGWRDGQLDKQKNGWMVRLRRLQLIRHTICGRW